MRVYVYGIPCQRSTTGKVTAGHSIKLYIFCRHEWPQHESSAGAYLECVRSTSCIYASPSSGDAYSDRQLTHNFEL